MCGTGKKKLGQIFKVNENVRCLKTMVTHSIIHQQVFRSKHLNLSCIIEPVGSIVVNISGSWT